MAQIFGKASNSVARVTLLAIFFGFFGFWGVVYAVYQSPYTTRVNVPLDQPVPFSHQHHVAGLGLDCRYCHTSVETSSFAGLPPTETCMTCHSQVWRDAPMLEPVRASLRDNVPLKWNRVNDLPDFVYFNHSIHVNKGIGCATCHGQVDEMPLMMQEASLQMEWCLGCHRNPERYVRPRDAVFRVDYVAPANQMELGTRLVAEY